MTKDPYIAALKLLNRRPYPKNKLLQKLKQKGFNIDESENALEQLRGEGLFRENEYKESRIRGLIQKNYAQSFIIQKCQQEGLTVTSDEVEKQYEHLETNEANQVTELLQKKLRLISPNTEVRTTEEKLLAYVLRKGHHFTVVKRILGELRKHGKKTQNMLD